jgi:hypothetical protein
MDNRRRVTAALVALIIIVPVVAGTYWYLGPSRLTELSISNIAPDNVEGKGIYIIGSATGGGQSFSKNADLIIYYADEQVYAGKATFKQSLLNQYLPLDRFAVGNGEYEFRLRYGGVEDRYYYELGMLVEELGVYATGAYDTNVPGIAPYECAYSYTVTFMTGWHYWTETIDPSQWYTWDLGFFGPGNVTHYRLTSDVEGGLTAKVFYKDQAGKKTQISSQSIPAGTDFNGTVPIDALGTYSVNLYNEMSVPLKIRVFQDRNAKTTSGQSLQVDMVRSDRSQSFVLWANRTEDISGYLDPDLPRLGPGYFNVSWTFVQPITAQASKFRTVGFSQELLLNDRPYADVSAGRPYELNTFKRTLHLDATNSIDDGPMSDIYVYWSFGTSSQGVPFDEAEGPWNQYKTVDVVYPSEFPDPVKGKPYLVLKDAFGTVSETVYVPVQVG